MSYYSAGGYIEPSVRVRVRVYDHGDHRSLTPEVDPNYPFLSCARGHCDRIYTKEEVAFHARTRYAGLNNEQKEEKQ